MTIERHPSRLIIAKKKVPKLIARKRSDKEDMMAVAAAQKNREMFAIKKSYSIEVSLILK